MNKLSRTARLIAAVASVAITSTLLATRVRHRRAAAQRADRQARAGADQPATTSVNVALASTASVRAAK
jgi:hypothetical protein